jgi:hypothetical protein
MAPSQRLTKNPPGWARRTLNVPWNENIGSGKLTDRVVVFKGLALSRACPAGEWYNMARKTIKPERNEDLERLFDSYLAATKRSIEALRAGDVEGFIEEDAKAGQMLRRIKELRGITGRSW